MKSHNITTKQTFKYLFPPGKNCENVVAGEGSVMEKGDFQIWTLFANEARCQPQVVVVDPDGCTLSGFSTGSICETTINNFKYFPVGVIDVEMSWECVKDWPEAFLGCDVIKTGYLFVT